MRNIFLVFIMSILFVGCSQNEETNEPNNPESLPNEVEKTSNKNDMIQTNEEIAEHLATIANDVPNVHDAASIVAGPFTVVAIDIDDMTERERVGTVKYSVTEALQHDPYGRTAVVIADADMMTRVREMGSAIRTGEPITGITDELAKIVSRYMPTIPPEEQNIKQESEQLPPGETE